MALNILQIRLKWPVLCPPDPVKGVVIFWKKIAGSEENIGNNRSLGKHWPRGRDDFCITTGKLSGHTMRVIFVQTWPKRRIFFAIPPMCDPPHPHVTSLVLFAPFVSSCIPLLSSTACQKYRVHEHIHLYIFICIVINSVTKLGICSLILCFYFQEY